MPSQASVSDATADHQLAINGGTPCVVDKPASYLHGPQEVGEEEIAAVTAVLRKKRLFRYGPQEDSPAAQLEARFGKMTQVPHALAVSSGTSALIAAMVGLGLSSGDEVIVPAYTYIATPSAALTLGAIPVIAEIDASLTLDPADVERKITPRTRLIVPVHMRGTPCRMNEIMAIAKKHKIKVLEDVAQANGGNYFGKPLGSIGDAGAFSLQEFKIITAGEGGIVTTSDRQVYERAGCYHDAAYLFWKKSQETWTTESFHGANYRMSEMNAALALAQLGRREGILSRLRSIKKTMIDVLGDLQDATYQDVPDPQGDCATSLVLLADAPDRAKRIAAALRAEGMNAGSLFDEGIPDRHIYYHWEYILKKRTPDLHGFPWKNSDRPCQVEYSPDMCPRTLHYLQRTVTVPLTQVMSDRHVKSCIVAMRKVFARL